ncbi:MAG: LytTR family DNA-binding domain-containing protein [Bacteroidota bacterium]|nr:LytTR family DNA-binding domain-containing protein [Bacteroidota bacterium]MDP4275386.1 LytTR family DNA-binding domain-containing protein [Bacteroidota bacterium]
MIRTLAIDDEPLALQLVEGYIKRTPFLELAGSFDNPLSAMEFIENEKIDLIFLDIQMPDLTGTEFARLLSNGPKIIFTTAYEKYAIESYKLDAIGYLLKPFEYEEFLEAAKKAKHLIELEKKATANIIESNNEFLFLKSDYKIRRINFNDILYIEGLKDYIKVFLINEHHPILSLSSLKVMEEKLPADKFMRVHRSFIVNLDRITTIERMRIVFGDVYIPVSDQYKEKFQEYMDKNFL